MMTAQRRKDMGQKVHIVIVWVLRPLSDFLFHVSIC